MPTGPDEPPAEPAGEIESFLSAVQGMVHGGGEDAPLPLQSGAVAESDSDATDAASPDDWVADDGRSDWLPGTWVVDAPASPRRRADRRMDKSLAKQEKKLRNAERRNANRAQKRRRTVPDEQPAAVEEADAPAGLIPAQPGPTGDRPDARGRRQRRRRRQEDARAAAVLEEGEESELVPSGTTATVGTAPTDSGRTDRRSRRRRPTTGGGGDQSGDSAAGTGGSSDNSLMSTVDTDPVPAGPGGGTDEPSPVQADGAAQSRAARRAERTRARDERRRELRAAAVQEQLAAEAARAARSEEARRAKADRRERRLDAKLARKAAAAAKRERRAEESAARPEVEAPADPVAEVTDGAAPEPVDRRADAERERLEGRLARLEARATARADKEAQRLARAAAKADAKAQAEAEALDRRQDRRARRIEKLRSSADARTAKEIADVERRRERRAGRLAKMESRARAKAHEDAARLEQLRVEPSILPRPSRVRRTVRIVGVCVLIGGAAVLPWAAPQVASVIGDALPGGNGHVATTKDPPVGPPANSVAGPVGIATESNPLEGKRLVAAGWPRRVQVPRLHVDSTVVPISGQSGELLPPDDPQVLGWWREGKPVGAQFGSAVITGHTVHTGGGALDNLAKLAVGDMIRTQTDDGWITYVVQRTRIYSTEELARDASDIFRLSGPGRLVMITCDDWNGSFYESNAVVFATPTSDDPFEGEGVGHVPDPGPGATP